MRRNVEICLADMNKDRNLQDCVGIEVMQFNLVVVKESPKEIPSWNAKSALEEGDEYCDFVSVF